MTVSSAYNSYKYLGVLLDPSLNMKEHLQKTLKVHQHELNF